MFTVTDAVANNGRRAGDAYPYGLVSRHGMPHVQGFYILHEGLIGVVDGSLEEIGYKKAHREPGNEIKSDLGLARHHRQILGDSGGAGAGQDVRSAHFAARRRAGAERFQTDYLMARSPIATRRQRPRPRAMSLPARRKSISSTATPRNTRSPNSTC